MSTTISDSSNKRVVVVSNRLPVTVTETDEGQFHIHQSSGGLVSALEPILKKGQGTWIGWTGYLGAAEERVNELVNQHAAEIGYKLIPVPLTPIEVEKFYFGFSNEIIWPLFHDFPTFCNFEPTYWEAYRSVEDTFASSVKKFASSNDLIWVQDFHLMGLGKKLRDLSLTNDIGFFLHIPFPSPDIFLKLPWRKEVLNGLMEYDIVGFQTERDLANFTACVSALLKKEPATVEQRGVSYKNGQKTIHAKVFPISIDFDEFDLLGKTAEVRERAQQLRESLNVPTVMFSVDRLDYTKGILYRLRSFHAFLSMFPDFRAKISLIQVVVPSRQDVDQYQNLKKQIEQLVTQINGEFAEPGWTPVQHYFRSISKEELAAFYLAADIGLVTPLKDGMNLVAKEFCATQSIRPGCLVLSEFAGAAFELGAHSLLVNPYDIDEVAKAIHKAAVAAPFEAERGMKLLREIIKKDNVFVWSESFLGSLANAQKTQKKQFNFKNFFSFRNRSRLSPSLWNLIAH